MTTFRQYVVFGFLYLLPMAFLWPPFVDTFALAIRNEKYTHILLILPISTMLIYLEWNSSRISLSWNSVGSFLLAGGLLVALFAQVRPLRPADVQLAVSILGLVITWIGAFVLCCGTSAARSVIFPLGFLFWMVPIPSFALTMIVQFLQHASASASSMLFSAFGVPVVRQGVFLSIPGLNIEVAKECSSIRSSLMLVVTTMVLAQVLLSSPWRKALVIVLSIPIAVAKNGLRIFVIAMLGTRVDPEFLTGKLHHQGGIVFFMISLVIVFLLISVLRRGEKPAFDRHTLAASAAS
jgi:exosortase